MPDRRRRAALLLPQPVTTPGGVTPLGARTPAAGPRPAPLGDRAASPWGGRPRFAAGSRMSLLAMAAHEPGTGDGPSPAPGGAGGSGGREPGGPDDGDGHGTGNGGEHGAGGSGGDGSGGRPAPGPDEPSDEHEARHAGHVPHDAVSGHVESPEQREARHAGHDNPFAPPPEGTPDQEWRPRHPRTHAHTHPTGQDGEHHGDGQGQGGNDREDHDRQQPPAWGSQWSSRQPGRGLGAPGGRPTPDRRPEGPAGGLRWDPSDPSQRRARYALLAGMWAFFFVLFSLPEVALLLAALSLYWGISSLRGRSAPAKTVAADLTGGPARPGQDEPAAAPRDAEHPGGPGQGTVRGAARPQATAAIGGLVTAGVALLLIAGSFTIRIVYKDYYGCVNDALTQTSRQSCEHLLPKELRPLLSAQR